MNHISSSPGDFYILCTDTTRRPVSYQWCALPYFINFHFVLLRRYFLYSVAKFYHFSFDLERKRRKTENEKRRFSSKWTDLFCFNLLGQTGARPVCSIYYRIAAIMKAFNVKRHYQTVHKWFGNTFAQGSKLCKSKTETLSTPINTRRLNNKNMLGLLCKLHEHSLNIRRTLSMPIQSTNNTSFNL